MKSRALFEPYKQKRMQSEKIHHPVNQTRDPVNQRNFIAGLWHGAFLAFGMSLTDPTTVISAFVVDLTGSTVWVGGLSTVLTMAGALPQVFVARWLEPKPRKRPYLLAAISLRVLSWAALAWLIYSIGSQYPTTMAWILVGMLAIFYAGGGLANIPYTDIIGKIIPLNRRGAFFGGKGALAGPLSISAAVLARQILADVAYPNNYVMLFGLAALGLAVASLGFWVIREPLSVHVESKMLSWREYWQALLAAGHHIKELIWAQLLTGFSLMAMPFYVVFALKQLNAPSWAVGWFLLLQVLGGSLSNLVWARLVDNSGSRRMLFVCALVSTLTPVLAAALGTFGWEALLPIFFLAGATANGRITGFQSALLEVAPETKRSTYAGLNAVLILPIAFLSLAAGLFLQYWSFPTLFLFASGFIGIGAVVIYHWSKH